METKFLYHYYQQLRFGTLFKLLSKRNSEKKNKCLSDVEEFIRCKEAPKTIMHCLRDSEMINNILEKFINMETTIEHLFQYWFSSILVPTSGINLCMLSQFLLDQQPILINFWHLLTIIFHSSLYIWKTGNNGSDTPYKLFKDQYRRISLQWERFYSRSNGCLI